MSEKLFDHNVGEENVIKEPPKGDLLIAISPNDLQEMCSNAVKRQFNEQARRLIVEQMRAGAGEYKLWFDEALEEAAPQCIEAFKDDIIKEAARLIAKRINVDVDSANLIAYVMAIKELEGRTQHGETDKETV